MTASKLQTELIKHAKLMDILGFNSKTPGKDGEPDMKFLFRWGRWYYIEVKVGKDILKELQKKRISDYRKLGQICYVVKKLEEGKDILNWHKRHQKPYPHYDKENEK